MHLTLPFAEYRQMLGVYLRPERGRVALLTLLLVGSLALQLINPQIIRYFIDATQTRGDLTPLVYAGIAFIGVSLLQRLLAVVTTYLSVNVSWSATNSLRAALTEHLLRLDMPFHKTHTPGELIERVDGDVNELADFFGQFVVRVFTSGLLVLGVIVLLLIENWLLGLALALYGAVSILALAALQGMGVRRWRAARQAAAEQYGYIEERISGVEDIQGIGAAPYVLARLFSFMGPAIKTRRSAEMVESFSSGLSNLIFAIGWALGLGIGAYLYSQGRITIGTVFLIISYVSMLAGPLESLRKQASTLQRSTAGMSRIAELFRLQPDVRHISLPPQTQDQAQSWLSERGQKRLPKEPALSLPKEPALSLPKEPALSLPKGALSVHFDGVSFAYADTEPRVPSGRSETEEDREAGLVLRDVSFSLPAGRVLGVLGRTGSGKTTITRLLFRLYDSASGAVKLGDVDVRDVGLDDLRARVGMVTQDVQLFSSTLRDNISFFDPTVSDERIVTALDALGLRDWLSTMPLRLDTRLAAGGAGMSAGEAQLLAFTRLLLKDPGLVILDEAASRLDPITERRLERAITRLLQPEDGHHRTAIIIAHRLRTVQRADDILILEGGRVVEYGPRAQLAADHSSRFYHLLQTGVEEALA